MKLLLARAPYSSWWPSVHRFGERIRDLGDIRVFAFGWELTIYFSNNWWGTPKGQRRLAAFRTQHDSKKDGQ
jgi:hypothetical protein